jgi:hypothetical protein
MSKDRYSYVAVFSYEEDGISIEFPDLPGCLPCAEKDNTEEALKNAKEALGLHIFPFQLRLHRFIWILTKFLY